MEFPIVDLSADSKPAAADGFVELTLYNRPLAVDLSKVLYVHTLPGSERGRAVIEFKDTDDSVFVDQDVAEVVRRFNEARKTTT